MHNAVASVCYKQKGQRLDAMDERGNWYPAQVVAVERNNSFTDHKNNDLRQSKRVTDNYNPLKAVRYIARTNNAFSGL